MRRRPKDRNGLYKVSFEDRVCDAIKAFTRIVFRRKVEMDWREYLESKRQALNEFEGFYRWLDAQRDGDMPKQRVIEFERMLKAHQDKVWFAHDEPSFIDHVTPTTGES